MTVEKTINIIFMLPEEKDYVEYFLKNHKDFKVVQTYSFLRTGSEKRN